MGGKKKTKWRKLPLEEFTKENSPKQEQQTSTDNWRTDTTQEETDFIPTYNGPPEVIQNYTEPYEYIDGIWYPTSCVVYNPGLFSNYMMPADTCYYYSTMPEPGQMQDYMPVPYQEYTPALPKDTVYLLLPTQALRPTQSTQNVAPEWQSRRRRRRHEGYAEYAVIPEKTSSSKTEIKDHNRPSGAHTRRSIHHNNFRRMSSLSETSSSDGLASEPNQIPRKTSETKKNTPNINKEKSPSCVNKEVDLPNSQNGHAFKKNPEVCGVHSKSKTTGKEPQIGNEKTNTVSINDELASGIVENPKSTYTQKQHFDAVNNKTLISNEVSEDGENSNNSNKETDMNTKTSSLILKDDLLQESTVKKETKLEEPRKAVSQTSLPDIVSSMNNTPNGKLQEVDNSCRTSLCDNAGLEKEKSPKQNPFPPQMSNTQHFETLHNEMEMELKKLQSLKVSQADQSLYKIAYDENVTDQSSNSRSPSPLRPEDNIPCTFYHDEINVHEAASDDDAGSEDIELIPHRYESESYLLKQQHRNHLYVNKLSLAVELLRTQENLPYDDDFKRIVGENDVEPSVHSSGNVNFGFKRDSCSPEKSSLMKSIQNISGYNTKSKNGIASQRQLNPSPDSNDSAIFSDTDFTSLENESRESCKEETSQASGTQDNSNEIRAEYRRMGIRARRQFSPFPFNPCFCCIIM